MKYNLLSFFRELVTYGYRYFCVSFGHKESFDQVTEQIVRDLGFTYSVSTKRAQLHSNTNPFSIPRLALKTGQKMNLYDK